MKAEAIDWDKEAVQVAAQTIKLPPDLQKKATAHAAQVLGNLVAQEIWKEKKSELTERVKSIILDEANKLKDFTRDLLKEKINTKVEGTVSRFLERDWDYY